MKWAQPVLLTSLVLCLLLPCGCGSRDESLIWSTRGLPAASPGEAVLVVTGIAVHESEDGGVDMEITFRTADMVPDPSGITPRNIILDEAFPMYEHEATTCVVICLADVGLTFDPGQGRFPLEHSLVHEVRLERQAGGTFFALYLHQLAWQTLRAFDDRPVLQMHLQPVATKGELLKLRLRGQ